MTKYKVGFTGTQRGTTYEQQAVLAKYFIETNKIYGDWEFHEGDCIGSDDEATAMSDRFGAITVCHPPINSYKRVFRPTDRTKEPKPYIERNHDIVDECDELIATPGEETEQLRSGTWATIRYARKTGKPIRIILPSGTILIQ